MSMKGITIQKKPIFRIVSLKKRLYDFESMNIHKLLGDVKDIFP